MSYTEENQKAEFIGGAIAGGCGLLIFIPLLLLLMYGCAAATFGD